MEARWWPVEGLLYTAEGYLPIYWPKGVPMKQFGNEVEMVFFLVSKKEGRKAPIG